MFIHQKIRLCALLCGALTMKCAPDARAQPGGVGQGGHNVERVMAVEAYPAPAQTPESAGEAFYLLLAGVAAANARDSANRVQIGTQVERSFDGLGSLSRAQTEAISKVSVGAVRNLLTVFAYLKDQPQFEARIVGKDGDKTLVEVVPATDKKRQLVIIEEDGGFRVDLKATYGRWNNLSGDALDLAWFQVTGDAAPSLAQNPEFQRAQENAKRSSCQSNLKQAMLGILQYSQDYDQHYPTANKWIDEIYPYVKNEAIFRCPALAEGQNYGYAFNQNLAGLSLAKFDSPAQTVAIYETDDLTRNAYGVQDERAYRHLGGSNLAFADGHVKWFAEGKEDKDAVQFTP